jgi:hypothetical protein
MKKTISYFFVGAMMVSAATMSSCKKNSSDPGLPPIGGYSSSDSVAAANLVAKWSFENSLTESHNNISGVGTGVNYTAGKKGQAWQGSASAAAYAVYTTPAAWASSLTSYSVAFWMNTDSMKLPLADPTPGHGAQGLFSVVNAADFWGGMNLFIENRNPADGDTLKLKLLVNNVRTGVVWQGQGPILRIPGALNTWIHVVLTYDGASGKFTAYMNGAQGGKMEVPYGPVTGGSYTQYANDPGGITNPNGAAIHGNIQLPASTQVALGSFQFTTTPALNTGGTQQSWATTYAGKMDEFRVYKSALSSAEVSALFQLESAGR